MTRVLDTSVAVAWYLPESFSASARQWQDRMMDGEVTLLVPSLHFWEFGNVLRSHVARGELGAEQAGHIFATHLDAPLRISEPDRHTVFRRALDYRATVYDAVYIALALQHRAPLLTAEKTTTPWVVKLGRLADGIR